MTDKCNFGEGLVKALYAMSAMHCFYDIRDKPFFAIQFDMYMPEHNVNDSRDR